MKGKLERPSPREDAEIARGIAADPDAAPDLSRPVPGIVRRIGRPLKADPKVSVTLRKVAASSSSEGEFSAITYGGYPFEAIQLQRFPTKKTPFAAVRS